MEITIDLDYYWTFVYYIALCLGGHFVFKRIKNLFGR